jgi:hypothetical protein
MATRRQLIALHKHWTTADAVDHHLRRSRRFADDAEPEMPEAIEQLGNMMSLLSVITVWYSLLFVVMEGYQELGLHDPVVDELLSRNEYVDALRRFRNSTFHYQQNPLSSKHREFIEAEDSEIWIRELNRAFDNFFDRELKISEDIARWRAAHTATG